MTEPAPSPLDTDGASYQSFTSVTYACSLSLSGGQGSRFTRGAEFQTHKCTTLPDWSSFECTSVASELGMPLGSRAIRERRSDSLPPALLPSRKAPRRIFSTPYECRPRGRVKAECLILRRQNFSRLVIFFFDSIPFSLSREPCGSDYPMLNHHLDTLGRDLLYGYVSGSLDLIRFGGGFLSTPRREAGSLPSSNRSSSEVHKSLQDKSWGEHISGNKHSLPPNLRKAHLRFRRSQSRRLRYVLYAGLEARNQVGIGASLVFDLILSSDLHREMSSPDESPVLVQV